MKARNKRVSAFLLTALMVISLGTPVSAKDDSGLLIDTMGSEGETSLPTSEELEKVNENKVGKITLRLTDGAEGTSKAGVEFSCLKVADITDGEYVISEEFEDLGVDLNDIKNAKELEGSATKLAENANVNSGYLATTDMNGKLTFMDLEVGVYLLQATKTDNYDNVTPFLVAIPTFDHSKKEMAYEIKVTPKHDPKPVSEPEPKPAPQTNVDSPVLLYFGGAGIALLMLIGVNIIFKVRKKKVV